MLLPVIMAGGSGSRLWPLSRTLRPKQFLSLSGEGTMLQQTLARLNGLDFYAPIVICNEDHRFLVAEQLREIDCNEKDIILEPCGRNTAPAIALAALYALEKGEDPDLLVLSADHLIDDLVSFQKTIFSAESLSVQGKLVTFGVLPSRPETGYGYIQKGSPFGEGFNVTKFVEKPDISTAQAYVDSGKYLWNSGMFMFRASKFIEQLGIYSPEILASCKAAIVNATRDLDFVRVDFNAFSSCPEDSIDYAVMEKTDCACVVPLDVNWSDVGSWSSLWDIASKSPQGNVIKGDVIVEGAANSLIRAESRLVAAVGVKDLLIVETKDAVLVADKNNSQDVKKIVNRLKKEKRPEFESHREVFRPWGKYDSVDEGDRYQVKRITVKPGEKLSTQMHHHRAEHWVVVSGTARVTNGDAVKLLSENESIYIPIGAVHCLENPGKIDLELIEVQSGSYLGEDDIVRFEDLYGRS